MLLLVFLLWQIKQKQHQYVDIYIHKLSSCKKIEGSTYLELKIQGFKSP